MAYKKRMPPKACSERHFLIPWLKKTVTFEASWSKLTDNLEKSNKYNGQT